MANNQLSSGMSQQQLQQQAQAYMSGYLFKRSHTNAFKKWHRRWFTLVNAKLYYQKRSDYRTLSPIESDLRICKVREVSDSERRFTFEIVSPKCRHLLQADNQHEWLMWMSQIERAINDALNNSTTLSSMSSPVCYNNNNNSHEMSSPYLSAADVNNEQHNHSANNESLSSHATAFDTPTIGDQHIINNNNSDNSYSCSNGAGGIESSSSSSLVTMTTTTTTTTTMSRKMRSDMKKAQLLGANAQCADCEASQPTWVSINIGCVVCIECSGHHRGLGVHISKVRSVHLDELDDETLSLLIHTGNEFVNRIYERRCNTTTSSSELVAITRATRQCDSGTREAWIRAKYESKRFVRPLASGCATVVRIAHAAAHKANTQGNKFALTIVVDDEEEEEKAMPNADETRLATVRVSSANDLLHLAAAFSDLHLMAYAIAVGADVNSFIADAGIDTSSREASTATAFGRKLANVLNLAKSASYTPLIKTVLANSLLAAEMLLLNGARLAACDSTGQSALHHATILKNLK